MRRLTEASVLRPVEGNVLGTYLTLASIGALIFGIINIVGNFGTIFVDQSYWQRAIAARPRAATGGFILGGLAWFAIPFTLSTTLGLAAVATGMTLTEDQIGLGLVAPTAAANIMGDLGAILILTIVFTAVVAAGSSQLVSVSSLITYDVFRTYLKPSASGRELMQISRFAIIGFGLGMGLLALLLFQLGISLQYVYLTMGILIGSAVAPISLAILWKKTNRHAATGAALAGLASGLVTWLLVAYLMFGEVSMESTGSIVPLLAGNITSILTGLAITVGGSLTAPERFDFSALRQKILLVDDRVRSMLKRDTDERLLLKASTFCKRVGFGITMFLVIVWPLSMYLTEFVLTLDSFTAWIFLAVVWAFGAAGVTLTLPLIEARTSIGEIIRRASAKKSPDMGLESEQVDDQKPIMKILVPVDGSIKSLKALNSANYLFRGSYRIKIYLLHVMEWSDEDDENMDEELTAQLQEEGRLVLRSVVVPRKLRDYSRIIKLGNPPRKIAEVADSLAVDLIVMGKKGLGGTDGELGHVSRQVLALTTKPVTFI